MSEDVSEEYTAFIFMEERAKQENSKERAEFLLLSNFPSLTKKASL
jgi:hypothetical protein